MNRFLTKVSTYSFYLFFFFLPLQVRLFLFDTSLFNSGFFNPFLSHYIYLFDVFFLIGLLFYSVLLFFSPQEKNFFRGKKRLNFALLFFGLFGFFLVSLFFSVDFFNSFIYLLRFLEGLIVFSLILFGFISFRRVLQFFLTSMFFVSILGFLQFVLQSSLGFSFIGEPLLSTSIKGVSYFNVFGATIIRPYATFAHPNIFAVFLAFAVFSSLYLYFLEKRFWFEFVLLFFFFTFLALVFLTFSRTVFFALFISFVVFLFASDVSFLKKLVVFGISTFFVGLFLFIFKERFFDFFSLVDRGRYLDITGKLLFSSPFGVGAGNFTEVSQKYVSYKLDPWSFQPVHDLFLLYASELGVFASFYVLFVFGFVLHLITLSKFVIGKAFSLAVFSFFFIVSLFDHYFLTSPQGIVLFFMFFLLMFFPVHSKNLD